LQGVNEPGELPRIGAVLAALRGLTPAALAEATTRNAVEALPKLQALLGPDVTRNARPAIAESLPPTMRPSR
jgi:hypothetical protein